MGCPVSARVRVLGGHRVVSFAREFIDEFRGKGRIVDAEAGRGKKTNDPQLLAGMGNWMGMTRECKPEP